MGESLQNRDISENDLKPHFCPLPLVCSCGSNGRVGLFHSTICHNQVNNWVKWKNVWFINCIHWLDRKPVHSYLHISVVSSAQICLRDMVDKILTCYNILLLHTGLLLLYGDKWRKSYRVAGVNVAQEMGRVVLDRQYSIGRSLKSLLLSSLIGICIHL